ncbi:DUF397 domain-containing protein [Streptomyces sp. MA15]|uniref:DUF397 domain-containing protein n=1 Tax=Streptomyces sp. MA15 TaxID=3055061 RepID=UPI0025AF06CD|nr:DUF397 domain-containing protein [Streptomyces sp. MA15]MDN3267041.1 DUF397 domain-containing protein [Streptomyces sp. MA15]
MRTVAYAQAGPLTTDDEALPVWRKSSHSNPFGDCVEVAQPAGGQVLFRDSKAPEGGVVRVSRPVAAFFTTAAACGAL